ncbi:SsrA-binding protein [Candidatus Dependentiae bacterium]|nr:MAG: SsrA-binding protein [Candidatus Dependentiae bacterium]
MKIISKNRRAFFDYEILDKYEAGLILTGDEVKSIRKGQISLNDAFGNVRDGKIILMNCYIAPYRYAYEKGDENTRRNRDLLLNKREINKIIGSISRKGLTLIPLSLYFNKRGYIKLEIGVGKHKKLINKKQQIKDRDIARETAREVRHSTRS